MNANTQNAVELTEEYLLLEMWLLYEYETYQKSMKRISLNHIVLCLIETYLQI